MKKTVLVVSALVFLGWHGQAAAQEAQDGRMVAQSINAPGVEVTPERITAPGIEITAGSEGVARLAPEDIRAGEGQIIVKLGGVVIDVPQVYVQMNGDEVRVEKTATGVRISSRGVSVQTEETVSVEEDNISIVTEGSEVQIRVLPRQIRTYANLGEERIEEVYLRADGTAAVYEITSTTQGRILGFLAVDVPTNVTLNATTGKTEAVTKPWWRIFLFV